MILNCTAVKHGIDCLCALSAFACIWVLVLFCIKVIFVSKVLLKTIQCLIFCYSVLPWIIELSIPHHNHLNTSDFDILFFYLKPHFLMYFIHEQLQVRKDKIPKPQKIIICVFWNVTAALSKVMIHPVPARAYKGKC